MANAILFIGWNRPFAGQSEKAALEYLTNEVMPYLKKLEGQAFERFDVIGLTAHGGDLNSAIILYGQRAKLDEVRRTDEFEAFAMKMGSLFDRFGVIPGVNWEGIQEVMKRWKP